MPFQSEKQKAWMYANKPEMAKEWSQKEKQKEYAKQIRASATNQGGGSIGSSMG